jgi:hypothetical protein
MRKLFLFLILATSTGCSVTREYESPRGVNTTVSLRIDPELVVGVADLMVNKHQTRHKR